MRIGWVGAEEGQGRVKEGGKEDLDELEKKRGNYHLLNNKQGFPHLLVSYCLRCPFKVGITPGGLR